MKKYSFYLLVLFLLATTKTFSQEKHEHIHSQEELTSFIKKSSVGDIVDYITSEVSFMKISDDIRLNLYKQSHQKTIDFILDSRHKFARNLAKQLKSGKVQSLEEVYKMYGDWIEELKEEVELIPLDKENQDEQANQRTSRVLNGPCVNMDFEDGTFNGWELSAGSHPGNAYGVTGVSTVTPGLQHSIMSAGTDPVVGIPLVNPAGGGQYSARLGDGTGTGSRVAMLRQSYLVDATNDLFTYSYAIVVEDPPNHNIDNQPYFVVRVYDENGNDVPCGSYSVQSTASNPDFISAGNDVLYQNWKTAFAPLTAYIGQNVTIEFRAADCSQSGHYGYAYVDASCSGSEIITSTGDAFICGNDPLVLTAPPGATSYLWNTGETTQAITITAGGYYEVEMVPVTGSSCSITASITIGTAPYPVADLTAVPTSICENDSVTFTDNSTISSGSIDFWQWDFGNGITTQSASGPITGETNTIGTYDNPTHAYTTSGNFTATLTVTSDAGCAASATEQILVSPAPPISAGPDLTLCPGEPFTPQGQGGVSYTWDQGLVDGVEIAIGDTTITYAVVGVGPTGCTATDSITIFVDEIDEPDAGADQTICIGESVTLTASGASNYTWDNGVQDGVPFSPTQTTTYTVTYTSPNGCQASDEVTVTVNNLPQISAEGAGVCEGEEVTLSGTGGVSYTWDNGVQDGVPFTPPVGVSTYTVTGVDANGCENSSVVSVTVYAYPEAGLSVDPQTGYPPLEATIFNETTGDVTDYEWSFGDGTFSDEDFDTYLNIYNEGEYTVTVVASNEGCTDTASFSIIVEFPPLVYHVPNVFTPNGDGSNDHFHLGIEHAAEIELYIFNRWGNTMAEIIDVKSPGWDGRTPSGGEAAEGVYFFKYRVLGLDGQEVSGHGYLTLVRK